MSDAQKFDFLKEYLKGKAYLCVENLELTTANYNIAIAELKMVYAKPKALIQTHLCKCYSLVSVKSMTDVAALQRLHLTAQSHINALETLGVQKDTFVGLLGTKLMKLLPTELKKECSSYNANDITDITALLNFIRDQVDAAERCSRWKSETIKTPQQTTPTTPDLLWRSNGHACLKYDELEVSLIETESVVNARPLIYVAEGSDDPLPITPNQFLNNRRSNRTPPELAVNLMAHDTTIGNGLATPGICQCHLRGLRDGLTTPNRQVPLQRKTRPQDPVMVKTLNGDQFNRVIQSLHPLKLCEDQPEDVEVPPTPELKSEQEEVSPSVSAVDLV
ncbi:Uncharacterized protein APZ42_017768 [Daphnia magna]|uniref:Uncharacterized protein n=1 Tax=Daphnia magna TaxID=35525 RepID=A0A164ZLN6_9CRUS|nr:Uncharacterized protein APZ42_017768 [Daphnia magna]